MFLRVAALVLVTFLSGCSVLQEKIKVEKPTASVTSVSIERLSSEAVTLRLDVKLSNSNSFDLKTAGVDLSLLINNNKLASIVQPDANLSLPAKGNNKTQLYVTLTYAEVIDSVGSLAGKSEIDYGIEGKIAINLPVIGDYNIPVKYAGVLPIPKQPEVAFKNFSVDSVGFSEAKLSIELEVSNPNVFTINLANVSYQVKLQSKSLGYGEVASVTLPQGEERSISIPLTIKVSDMGTSLYKLLASSDPVEVSVAMAGDIDTNITGWQVTPVEFDLQQVFNR